LKTDLFLTNAMSSKFCGTIQGKELEVMKKKHDEGLQEELI